MEIGRLSTTLTHLGNISHKLRRDIVFDPSTETFPGGFPLATAGWRNNGAFPSRVCSYSDGSPGPRPESGGAAVQ